jgi:hypothetical protein
LHVSVLTRPDKHHFGGMCRIDVADVLGQLR